MSLLQSRVYNKLEDPLQLEAHMGIVWIDSFVPVPLVLAHPAVGVLVSVRVHSSEGRQCCCPGEVTHSHPSGPGRRNIAAGMRLAEAPKDLLGSTGEMRAPSLRVAVQIGGFLPLPVDGWLRRKSPDPYGPSSPLVPVEIVKGLPSSDFVLLHGAKRRSAPQKPCY